MPDQELLKSSAFHIGDRVLITVIGRPPSTFVWVVRRVYRLLSRGIVYDLERSAERGPGTISGILESRLIRA